MYDFLRNIGGAVTIITSLAAVVFGGLYGFKFNQHKTLEDVNKALSDLVRARDMQITDYEKQHNTNKQRIDELTKTVKILDDRVTQAPSINKMAIQLATQHKQLMRGFESMTKSINSQTVELSNIAKAVAERIT